MVPGGNDIVVNVLVRSVRTADAFERMRTRCQAARSMGRNRTQEGTQRSATRWKGGEDVKGRARGGGGRGRGGHARVVTQAGDGGRRREAGDGRQAMGGRRWGGFTGNERWRNLRKKLKR